MQSFTTKEIGQKHTVRAQRVSRLNELADWIIRAMQAKRMDYQIKGPLRQGEHVVKVHDLRFGQAILPDFGKARDNRDICKGSVNLL